MKIVVDKAGSRGYFDHVWLKTHHTFSFADYYNHDRMNFGALRVLNDDTVSPGRGMICIRTRIWKSSPSR